jgi:hypothetical protein
MKKLYVLAALLSLSAHAADDYVCELAVTQPGKALGTIEIAQEYGTSAGRLYTLPISVKKNAFGSTVRQVEITLSGVVNNGGQNSESTIDAVLNLETTTLKRKIKTTKVALGTVKGRGTVNVNTTAAGYTIQGYCETRDGE